MKKAWARRQSIDRLGALLSLVGLAALVYLPFVVFKANRIVPGDARSLLEILPLSAVAGCYAVLGLVAATALGVGSARMRLAAALIGVAAVTLTIGAAADALTPVSYTHLDVYKRQPCQCRMPSRCVSLRILRNAARSP